MLRLLLDEHISPAVADQLVVRCPEALVLALADWAGGKYLACPDGELLDVAHEHHLTLVTYDLRTIAPLLKDWAERGHKHSGVILVDDRTVKSNDIGGLMLALERLWRAQHQLNWKDRVVYLTGRHT